MRYAGTDAGASLDGLTAGLTVIVGQIVYKSCYCMTTNAHVAAAAGLLQHCTESSLVCCILGPSVIQFCTNIFCCSCCCCLLVTSSFEVQSGDAAFKDLLSSVVDTDCWQQAKDAAVKTISSLQAQLRTKEDRAQQYSADLATAQQRLQELLQQQQEWEQGRQQQQVRACSVTQAMFRSTSSLK
jgi:hypothetical protein